MDRNMNDNLSTELNSSSFAGNDRDLGKFCMDPDMFSGKDTSRENLLREVMAADFTLIDLNLYLDTHPWDMNALMQYNCALQRARMLRNNYERMYGPLSPMSPYAAMGRWRWIESPWPWEKMPR